ncbi:TetR/AcrR family transcriptional regulator [Desmospora activa]|uniref:TetR family transcriptional regulator n=1 Tax=Desmospora activa DSM 45169 TaxID=1121389 RepID=A0A2T4ZCJ0_9BACL|nr:TetR/AcrR family transcriptional regulator [Desmospora activa]PTM59596.1 TetR family transcriptional regulator [Desmospora activa DSM 45169]
MSKKIDRRKIRTKKLLRQALLELIEEKGVKGVTVSNLTNHADINRGTFYLHYRDVDDLMKQWQEELFTALRSRTQEINLYDFIRFSAKDKPYPVLISILEFIAEQADFLKVLFGPKGDPSFLLKWKQFMRERVTEKLEISQPEEERMLVPREYLITIVISTQLGIIQHWIETGLQHTPEEIATIMTRIAGRGPLATLGLKEGPVHRPVD